MTLSSLIKHLKNISADENVEVNIVKNGYTEGDKFVVRSIISVQDTEDNKPICKVYILPFHINGEKDIESTVSAVLSKLKEIYDSIDEEVISSKVFIDPDDIQLNAICTEFDKDPKNITKIYLLP